MAARPLRAVLCPRSGADFGPYITYYRMMYFTPSYDGYTWTLREGAEKEIYERLAPLALRMSADDYLEMPELIEKQHLRRPPDGRDGDLRPPRERPDREAGQAPGRRQQRRGREHEVPPGRERRRVPRPEVQALVKLPKSQREWANLHYEKIDLSRS